MNWETEIDFIKDMDALKKQLGNRIKELRLSRGLRQVDFDEGEPSGVALSVYQTIESGKANPSLITLYKIASKLGVDIKELFEFGKPPSTS